MAKQRNRKTPSDMTDRVSPYTQISDDDNDDFDDFDDEREDSPRDARSAAQGHVYDDGDFDDEEDLYDEDEEDEVMEGPGLSRSFADLPLRRFWHAG